MDKCVLCSLEAKDRKYFFKDMPLCEKDYASYLEYLLDDMKVTVNSDSADSAFAKLKIALEPEPAPAPSRSFRMKM